MHKAFQAGAFERVEGDGVLRLKVRAGAQNVAVWKGRNFLGTEKSGDGLVVRAQAGTCPWGKERVGGMVTAFQGYSAFFFFLASYPQRIGMNTEQRSCAVLSAYATSGMAQGVVDVAFREFPERGPW